MCRSRRLRYLTNLYNTRSKIRPIVVVVKEDVSSLEPSLFSFCVIVIVLVIIIIYIKSSEIFKISDGKVVKIVILLSLLIYGKWKGSLFCMNVHFLVTSKLPLAV